MSARLLISAALLSSVAVAACHANPRSADPSPEEEQQLRVACRAGAADACAELMAVTQSRDINAADRWGARACDAGHADTCVYLGAWFLVRSRAPSLDEKVGPLRKTARLAFRKSCELGHWRGCLGYAEVLTDAGADETTPRVRRANDQADKLARQSCEEGYPRACLHLAPISKWARKRACELASPQDTKKLRCRRAAKAGRTAALTGPHSGLKRVAGHTQVQPSDTLKSTLRARGIHGLDARLRACVSETGAISQLIVDEPSRAAAYDRALFTAVRSWRYRPHMQNGQAVAACTSLTFHYRQ